MHIPNMEHGYVPSNQQVASRRLAVSWQSSWGLAWVNG